MGFKLCKASLVKSLSYLLHKGIVKPQIMHNKKSLGKHFGAFKQMTEVGSAVPFTYGTAAIFVNGAHIGSILVIIDVYYSRPGEKMSVSGIAGGHYTVKEVYSPFHRVKDI